MTDVIASMNYGRWLVNCPKCGAPLPAEIGKGYTVCPVDWPDIQAWAFVPAEGGIFRRVPDVVRRQEAIEAARQAGELYTPVYPRDKDAMMKVLRQRPTENMFWYPPGHEKLLARGKQSEDLNDLITENVAHGLESGL